MKFSKSADPMVGPAKKISIFRDFIIRGCFSPNLAEVGRCFKIAALVGPFLFEFRPLPGIALGCARPISSMLCSRTIWLNSGQSLQQMFSVSLPQSCQEAAMPFQHSVMRLASWRMAARWCRGGGYSKDGCLRVQPQRSDLSIYPCTISDEALGSWSIWLDDAEWWPVSAESPARNLSESQWLTPPRFRQRSHPLGSLHTAAGDQTDRDMESVPRRDG